MAKKPVLLCIMDGFGWVPGETYGNAVVAVKTPHLDALMAKYPMTTIEASGMAVGIETAARVLGLPPVDFPQETAIGALALYISGGSVGDFQPMNVNFGVISPLGYRVKGKRNKNAEISKRSLEIIDKLMTGEVFTL